MAEKKKVLLVALCFGLAVMIFYANDKNTREVSAEVELRRENRVEEEDNPLAESADEGVSTAVLKYYQRLAENTEYVEDYEDVWICQKNGRYEGTWIVFAVYKMKIKGIYTAVPGLGTLYVERDAKGAFCVNAKVTEKEQRELIMRIAEHEDVKRLFEEVQRAYEEALRSDAMLSEVLQDLAEEVRPEDIREEENRESGQE